ncbi:MAG: baseplate J/gp47 family protein [Oscillospiraceae bacterium]
MFEAYTYEQLLEDVLANAPIGIDTRPGSIFYDAVSGPLLKIAKLYTDLDYVSELVFIDSATGEYLDRRATENGVTRLPATNCRYNVLFEGVIPEIGERFFTDGRYFTLSKTDKDIYYLMAEEAGTNSNGVYTGTPAVPLNNIKGLTAATFGTIMELGTNEETDDDLRGRIREKIAGPAENGNRQHYKTWCEEVEGVGRARIFPLWKGPNSVKGIIVNTLGTPADAAVVERVQAYIDPDKDKDGEGDGLGEGTANLGAHFTAAAAKESIINVSYEAVLTTGSTITQAKEETVAAISKHFKELALNTPENEDVVVRISSVGAIINGLSSILDYSNLTFNGKTANIEPGNEAVAILGEVTVVVRK